MEDCDCGCQVIFLGFVLVFKEKGGGNTITVSALLRMLSKLRGIYCSCYLLRRWKLPSL